MDTETQREREGERERERQRDRETERQGGREGGRERQREREKERERESLTHENAHVSDPVRAVSCKRTPRATVNNDVVHLMDIPGSVLHSCYRQTLKS